MAVVDLRYARALAAVVDEKKLDSGAVQAQLADFAATLGESPELREVLENPSIPEVQKLRVLDALAGRLGMNGTVRNFIALITKHGRLPELDAILAAYHAEADQNRRLPRRRSRRRVRWSQATSRCWSSG